MCVGDLNLDVRLNFSDRSGLAPGETARVSMKFLNPALAREQCSVGVKFTLRELRPIAEGTIEETAFGETSHRSAAISRVA